MSRGGGYGGGPYGPMGYGGQQGAASNPYVRRSAYGFQNGPSSGMDYQPSYGIQPQPQYTQDTMQYTQPGMFRGYQPSARDMMGAYNNAAANFRGYNRGMYGGGQPMVNSGRTPVLLAPGMVQDRTTVSYVPPGLNTGAAQTQDLARPPVGNAPPPPGMPTPPPQPPTPTPAPYTPPPTPDPTPQQPAPYVPPTTQGPGVNGWGAGGPYGGGSNLMAYNSAIFLDPRAAANKPADTSLGWNPVTQSWEAFK